MPISLCKGYANSSHQGNSTRCSIIDLGQKLYPRYFATPVSVSFKELVSRSMPLKLRPFDNFHVSFMPMALDVL